MYWDGYHQHHVAANRQPNQSAVSAKLKDASLIHIVIFRGANSGTLSGGAVRAAFNSAFDMFTGLRH